MLLRIVKMEFDPAQVQAFDELFAQSQALIIHFKNISAHVIGALFFHKLKTKMYFP